MNTEATSSVLIVDDNSRNLQVLADILTHKNYKLAMVRDGFKALKFIDKKKPDIILLDIMMPEIDGLEVCRRLKSNDNTKDIPVIFISALNETSDKIKGFKAGGVDYITKPFQKEEVFARLNVHLELKRSHENLKKINEELKKANQEITDSIQYARMIQRSLMSAPEKIKNYLPCSFIIWMPKDVVSGDIFFAESFPCLHPLRQETDRNIFYSQYEKNKNMSCSFQDNNAGFIIAVIDCTGHGVPGAFMTMIASSALKRIIIDEACYDPALILKRLNFIVKTTLHQDTEYAISDDGMDAAVVCVRGIASPEQFSIKSEFPTSEQGSLTFAGAKLSLFYTENNETEVIKGDKQSIGYKRSDLDFNFTNHTIHIRKGINFYMATDGFEDQLGKDEHSRFKSSRFGRERFINMLGEISNFPFEKQEEMILEIFHNHKGEHERQDDVTVLGFGF